MNEEHLPSKIEDLIIAATEPKDKALLMILNKISENLIQNTKLTETLASDLKQHRDEFASHEKTEMALINQGRGFLRAMVIALTLAQGVLVWAFTSHLQSEEELSQKVFSLEKFAGEHKVHHEMEERAKKK